MSIPPVAEPGRRSFSAVVHRGDGDNGSDPRNSTTSRSSTITPRPSTSSFKAGTDGGVVRSKRNFKHLGTVAVDPPPSPGLGDLGAGDLAALLQEAAWLEQRLYDENAAVPSDLGEEGQKAENSAPLPAAATKAGQATAPAPAPAPVVTTSSRTKGRGLTLGSFTSALSSHPSQSPIRSSPSTPSFQVHPDASPTQPKSGRGRKYFSLRGALRGPRLSMSSEMSSDDSAPVATPPSPSFDLQATQGHGNDSMSIRSMFSIRSNKSGKSDSAPGSLRLSPRRGMSRASSFAERLLNRASKTKSMLDDPGEIPSSSFYFKSRVLTRRLHSKMIPFCSGRPFSRLSFQKPRARFLTLLPSQRRQRMSAPLTGTFSTRSLMYRQRFRNGRRRSCSLYPPRQLPLLSRTSGTLLLLGFRRPRTVVVTSWAGYDRDMNHGSWESGVHMGVTALVILLAYDLCLCVEYTIAAVFMQHTVEMLVLVTDPTVRIASSRYPCHIHFRYPFCTSISLPSPWIQD